MKTFFTLIIILFLSGCIDMDPFGFSNKNILGDYYLEKWEDGKTFYLNDSEKAYEDFDDHGPIGGVVIEIGWSNTSIIAKRKAHFGGDMDGWMIVDSVNKEISGPFTWKEIIKNDEFKKVEILPAIKAWEQL